MAKRYLKRALSLKKAINKYGFDGSYFIGATKDDGSPLGSRKNKEGKIYLNSQTWAIISGSATKENAKKAMESARKYLYREYGPLLLTPAYTSPDSSIGYITRYAPGVRENGGVYTHAATWAMLAECLLKKADNAYSIYAKISPILRSHANPDHFKTEPYVLPGNTDGPESPFFGRAGWSWYTGSASWLFKVLTEYLLGVRPTYEGLLIDPCIPKTWASSR